MSDRINVVLTDEVLAEARKAAFEALNEYFGMPYGASVRDYDTIDELQRADAEAEAKNQEEIARVVNAVIEQLKVSNQTDKNHESRLRSIEYHLNVATDLNRPAIQVKLAENDLFNTDVPFLLDLVRSQAVELKALKEKSSDE